MTELRSWLNRPNLSFVDNLNFGIKVWNSIEFVLLTKQEIIVDEFCNNLPKLRKEIKKSTDASYAETAWQKVNEFLSFRYSSGAVSVVVKEKLIKTLSAEAEIGIKESQLSPSILTALFITLQNTSIQNYYKSNAVEFARFLAINIRYLTAILQLEDSTDDQSKTYKEHIVQLLTSLKAFIKQTPFLDEFKSAFAAHILPVLCELMILSQNRRISTKQELLSILQELYFDGNQTSQLKQYLSGAKSKFKTFHEIFETPMHVFLMIFEALVWSFRNDDEVQRAFLNYLYNENDGKFRTQKDEPIQTQLNGLTVLILLLKKYDVPLNFQIESNKAYVYLGKQIEYFVQAYHATYVYEMLSLLCATLKLNPLILEFSVCQIAVKFMLLAKNDETVWNKYEEFMFLLIEMYRKLSRAEKFISQLIKNLFETLSTVKLSKKLKRSFNSSFVAEGLTPSKKPKSLTDDDIALETTICDEIKHVENPFVKMFEANILRECDGLVTKMDWNRKIRNNQMWSDIAFAFSPAISSTYTRFISGLVSKPSLVVWKTLIFTLKDYVQQLKEAEGKCSENCIFLIEMTSALLSQYFMGSRLAEQSDKSWDAIETNRNATRDILSEFGHALLSQEHNYRTMNAFLKLSYGASNFDLLCWYYRPDSMRIGAVADEDKDNMKFDVEQCAKQLHSYLTEKEWTTIEQRITNFGKRECKANINKIYFQRLKANQLFELDKADAQDISNYVLSTAFKDVEQISDILIDQSLGVWFIGNLNAKQKRTVCELLLQSTSEFDTLNRLRAINDWQFVELLTFATYKKICDILAAGKHSEYLSTIDFEFIYERDFKQSSKQLGTLLENQCNETKCADKKLIQKKREQILNLMQLIDNLPVGFGKSDGKSIVSLLNIMVYRYLAVGGDNELSAIAVRIFKGKIEHFHRYSIRDFLYTFLRNIFSINYHFSRLALFHFGDAPIIFENLNVNTLITMLEVEPNAQSIFALIFEKTCRDLNAVNLKALDELFELLQQFETNEQNRQQLLLQISDLVICDLFKDHKNRSHCDRFRNVLFDIIKKLSKDEQNIGWLISSTLPAFVIVVKAYIAANKSNPTQNADGDDETIPLIKLFLKNSVNGFCPK